MARVGLDWSAEDLSDKCQVSRVTIARFESGVTVAAASVAAMEAALIAAGAALTQKAGQIGVTVPA